MAKVIDKDTYIHFGITLNTKTTKQYITRENCVSGKRTKNSDFKLNDELLEESRVNYDYCMKYFNALSRIEFNNELNNAIETLKKENYIVEQVKDLKLYKEVKGIYIMVLDKYKQVYIGQTTNGIRQRIYRHWNNEEREILDLHRQNEFAMLHINSFGALDTTKIYVIVLFNQKEIDKLEKRLIKLFSSRFILNGAKGGKPKSYDDLVVNNILFSIFFNQIKISEIDQEMQHKKEYEKKFKNGGKNEKQ